MDQLSFTEVGDILGLVERMDCDTFELEYGELHISVNRAGTAPPPAAAPPIESTPPPTVAEVEPVPPPTGAPTATAVAMTAPMTGSFYRAPAPGEPPCAEAGATVQKGQTVALVEVMKLFTELKAEVSGTVLRFDAEDGSLVEFGRPLLWIEPR